MVSGHNKLTFYFLKLFYKLLDYNEYQYILN